MQSKSAPKKKTSKAVADATPVVENSTTPAPSSRASQSSPAKAALTDGPSAKRHRKPKEAEPVASKPVVTATSLEQTIVSTDIVSGENLIASEPASALPLEAESALVASAVSEHEIRKLAYFYWEERGRPHGSHHEDWERAEKTLTASA